MSDDELIRAALEAREGAYAPYSGFKVGAALITRGGKVYLGCNIENSAYGDCICAERVALFKAVSEGERDFAMLAVAGGAPCGSCRQVLSEFCDDGMPILIYTDGKVTKSSLGELLPNSFRLKVTK